MVALDHSKLVGEAQVIDYALDVTEGEDLPGVMELGIADINIVERNNLEDHQRQFDLVRKGCLRLGLRTQQGFLLHIPPYELQAVILTSFNRGYIDLRN